MGDYEFAITELGRERARRYIEECTYFGSAPVTLPDYLNAMAAQTIAKQHATEEDLKRAFQDLIVPPRLLDRLGPAINSGRGMFLFGNPGNGKTSIAERVTRSFGTTIWIPRTLGHRRRHYPPLRPGHSRRRRSRSHRRHLESLGHRPPLGANRPPDRRGRR